VTESLPPVREWYPPPDRARPVRYPPDPVRIRAAHRDPARWVLRVMVLLGVVLGLLGGVRLAAEPRLPERGEVPGAYPGTSLPPAVGPGQVPVQLVLAQQRIDAAVVPVGVLPDGELDVPADPAVLGWWRDGSRPGAGRGTVVIDGHVDTRLEGPGALYRLREMPLDAIVELRGASGVQRYVVRAVHSYPKAALPPDLFDRTGEPRLVLISCGGDFDPTTRQYTHNIVVYAIPTR
jgi:hypothetical protein